MTQTKNDSAPRAIRLTVATVVSAMIPPTKTPYPKTWAMRRPIRSEGTGDCRNRRAFPKTEDFHRVAVIRYHFIQQRSRIDRLCGSRLLERISHIDNGFGMPVLDIASSRSHITAIATDTEPLQHRRLHHVKICLLARLSAITPSVCPSQRSFATKTRSLHAVLSE